MMTHSNYDDMDDGEDENQLVDRVFSYSLVAYVSDTLKNCYSYAKHSNNYVKAGLEAAEGYSQPVLWKLEEYSHQPTIESFLHKVDQYGCKQLDKIESGGKQLKETYEIIRPKTIQSLETVANKIHGTPVEMVLLKTVDVVDAVVDSLLPPDPEESAEVSMIPTNDPNLLDRTSPLIKKLRNRVSKDSIKRLPAQTYQVSKDFIFRNTDAVPHLNYCIGVLSTAAHKIHNASSNTRTAAKQGVQKGTSLSKASMDYIYTSLHHMVGALTSLVVLAKKLDPIEAKATVEELTVMIQRSREGISHKGKNAAARLKEDISHILQKAGDLLSQQVAAGYTRVHTSDSAAIRKSVETIENIVLRILDHLPTQQNPQAQQGHHSEEDDDQYGSQPEQSH